MNKQLTLLLSLSFACFIFNVSAANSYKEKADSLLTVWCDGMISWQKSNTQNSELEGCLYCYTCDKIHGRCMDAVYPFMYLYNKTKDAKYLDAAISVMEWSENVTAPDGSWTVIPNPNSWKGITVFGAVSLTETLKHYDHLLPEDVKNEWVDRLSRAGDYIYDNFTLTFTNINYGISAIYALNLMGEYLDEARYISKSEEMLHGIEECFTEENSLLFGEGKPYDLLSYKGLNAVDLGYNVEETLNALAQYAVDANNPKIRELAIRSLRSHLEFMLPDGGWDNSWGTRQYKWSYWGSRTTEGCFPGYGVLAADEPIFAEAVVRSTELLSQCTDPQYGLISGGIHYHSHGVMPCIHHTFTHAKALASLLDRDIDFALFDTPRSLPCEESDGVKHFPEIDTWITTHGAWRATITGYDFLYHEGAQQATGGSIGVLYNNKVGLLLTASLAEYTLIEQNNQQNNPGVDFALTPRVEVSSNGKVYNNLYDHNATISYKEKGETIEFNISNNLKDSNYKGAANDLKSELSYRINSNDSFEYIVNSIEGLQAGDTAELIMPIVCSSSEKAEQTSKNKITIYKEGGIVTITSNAPLKLKTDLSKRIFNMVPGVEVLPLYIDIDIDNNKATSIKIEVASKN